MENIDDLLEGLLGLILAGHIPEGNTGLLLHIHLGVGLAHAAQAAHSSLAAYPAEQEHHSAHQQQDGKQCGDEQGQNIGRAVHRVAAVVGHPVLIQQVVDAQVGYWGRGCDIFLLLALAPEWDLHSSKDSLVPLLFLGQIGLSLFLHPFLQGDDVLAALHPHGLHQLRHHPAKLAVHLIGGLG